MALEKVPKKKVKSESLLRYGLPLFGKRGMAHGSIAPVALLIGRILEVLDSNF